MVTIRRVDASVMDRRSSSPRSRELSPKALERQRQQQQFSRMIEQLRDPSDVFEVRLGKEDKPLTVRQRLLRAAQDSSVEIAVRKHGEGFVVGLMTPERRTNRGRKPKAAAA